MKKILLAALLLSLCMPSFRAAAQNKASFTVTGQVVDSLSGDPVAYATVSINDADMNSVNAAAADMNGRFSIPLKATGNYKIVVSFVGYNTSVTDLLVAEGDRTKDVGKLTLAEGLEMETVSVVAQKPLIKIEPDKLVYSVEADPEASYSTLAEILRKVPQLSVDAEDNVLLNGQSDYKVLVNGKSSSMMSKNFKDVIKSMPANSIKDIEVITEPSTKYESEGVGGIINIITNRQTINGYSGRVSAGISSHGGYDASAYISTQVGKLNFSANYWFGRYGFPEDRGSTDYTNFLNTDHYLTRTRSKGSSTNLNHSLNLEASYEIDTFNLISLSFGGYKSKYESRFESSSEVFSDQDNLTREYENQITNRNRYNYFSGNLDYQRTFRKPDKTLTLSYRLESQPGSSFRTDDINGILDYPSRRERSYNDSEGSEHTIQVDYYDPLTKKHQIEAGVKYILRINLSESDDQLWDNGQWITNPDLSRNSDLDYDQHILGLYGGYLFKHKDLTAKAGFRMEGTWNMGTAKTADDDIKFDNTNFNVVPYVNLTYMLKSSQRLRFSYTQRLRRPGIWHLNPYVEKDEYNENMISYGNPDLKSAVSHSFSTGYSIFTSSWNLNVSASTSFSNENIVRYTFVNQAENRTETTYANTGKDQYYRLNASYNYRLTTRLNIYLNGNAGYSIIESAPLAGQTERLRNEGFNYGFSVGGSVGLWKDGRININGGYYGSNVQLQGKRSAQYYSSVGFSQRFFKQKLDLGISISNPFTKSQKYSSVTQQEGVFMLETESEYTSRRISFRVGFRFGKMDVQVKKARRSISNDDIISGGTEGGKS